MRIEAIILAGGAGARMRSSLPKSLHTVGGRPLLAHILDAVRALTPRKIHIVVSAERGDEVRDAIEGDGESEPADITWVPQDQPRGTGHAAQLAMAGVADAATVLVVYGDTPLIETATLRHLLAAAAGDKFGLLTLRADDAAGAAGLGRIVRDGRGRVARIVEEKDATAAQKDIRECNAGFIAASAAVINAGLACLGNDNAQHEFYLTDIVAHAAAAGVDIAACAAAAEQTLGVNTPADLARAGVRGELPEHPVVFTKDAGAVNGPYNDVVHDAAVSQRLDWEVELAVVVGRGGRKLEADGALAHVFGYTVANDITARDLQKRHKQIFIGKSLPGSCPMGPCIVTADEIADPQALALESRLNGEVKQSASTASQIFDVATVLSILSRSLVLEPGMIISTGTPDGVGYARNPPEYLQPGDVIECEVERIGKLANRIVAAKG